MSSLRMGLCGKLGKGIGLSTFPPLDSFFSFPLFPASPQAPLRSFVTVFSRSAISLDLSTIQKGTACSLQAVAARTQLP